jgi:hypothetical protein
MVRFAVTDMNEHFHSKVRAMLSGVMPSLCQFLVISYRVVMEMAKRLSNTGYQVFTGRGYYQTPAPTAMPWKELSAVICAATNKIRKWKKKISLTQQPGAAVACEAARGEAVDTTRANVHVQVGHFASVDLFRDSPR